MVGTVLGGRFQIEEVLGSGGMSVVYKATQLAVNRHVAIKTLRLQMDSKPIYRDRFQREISLLCALNHPHIVTVYDCVIGPDDQPYVVMDYLRGKSLEQLIKGDGAMPVERCARIAVQVLSALDHAHRKGVIHRDLKPGNIVLMDDETDFVKVVDFGLAKLNHDNRKLTQSGELWGSPPYMSPEQAMGKPEDERSDLYSLGAVLYEMLTGVDPFHYAVSVFELIQAHAKSEPPPIVEANAMVSIPPKLEQVIFKAMAKDPADRFQTAADMLSAVAEACSDVNSRDSGDLLLLADAGKARPTAERNASQSAQVPPEEDSGGRAEDYFKRALNPFDGMTLNPTGGANGELPRARQREQGKGEAGKTGPGGKPAHAKAGIENIGRLEDGPGSQRRWLILGPVAVVVAIVAVAMINVMSHRSQAPAPSPAPQTVPAPSAVKGSPLPADESRSSKPATVNEPGKGGSGAGQPGSEPVGGHDAAATVPKPEHGKPAAHHHPKTQETGVHHPTTHSASSEKPKHNAASSSSSGAAKPDRWDALRSLRKSQ
jgi:serine/threonine-protein kinase